MKKETFGFMSIKKVLLRPKLLPALRHNKREIQAELGCKSHIDAARTHLNVALRGHGTADELQQQVLKKLEGVRVRRDSPIIEVVFSLPADTKIDIVPYFEDCTTWAERRFKSRVISSDIHLDEATPHCHVLLLPLVDGALQGSSLVGYRWHLQQHHDSLHVEVGLKYGLPRRRRLGHGEHAQAVRLVMEQLANRQDPVLRSVVWGVVQQTINVNPSGFLDILGLEPPQRRVAQRSFTAIMISKGKGPQRETESS